MKDKLMQFLRDEEGLTTVEYAVAGALIAATVITAFTLLGGEVKTTINFMKDELKSANDANAPATP